MSHCVVTSGRLVVMPNLVVEQFDPHFSSLPRLNELIALRGGDVLFVLSVWPCPCRVNCTQPLLLLLVTVVLKL